MRSSTGARGMLGVSCSLKPTRCQRPTFVRDASNLPPFTEQDSPVVVGPEYLHDLARAGGVNRYQCPKTIHAHCVPPVVCPGKRWGQVIGPDVPWLRAAGALP